MDDEALQGTWVLASAVVDGQENTNELVGRNCHAVVKGKQMTFLAVDERRTLTIHIDPTRQPKTFDTIISLGIYELKGDELTLCLGGGKRPTAFASEAGSQTALFVYKRAES